ncbi:MAG: hypothetical protein ABIH41_01545 [Nanoarchaeota archaeon]
MFKFLKKPKEESDPARMPPAPLPPNIITNIKTEPQESLEKPIKANKDDSGFEQVFADEQETAQHEEEPTIQEEKVSDRITIPSDDVLASLTSDLGVNIEQASSTPGKQESQEDLLVDGMQDDDVEDTPIKAAAVKSVFEEEEKAQTSASIQEETPSTQNQVSVSQTPKAIAPVIAVQASAPAAEQERQPSDEFELPDFDDDIQTIFSAPKRQEPEAQARSNPTRPAQQPIEASMPAPPQEHFFVRVSDYVKVTNDLKDVGRELANSLDGISTIQQALTSQEASMQQWHALLNDTQEKLIYLDHKLFDNQDFKVRL